MSLLVFMIASEIFEIVWQKGNNIKEYLANLYTVYEKGVIYFSCLHLSFIFILFCIFALNLPSIYLLLIASIKFFDISFKIYLLDKISKNLPLGSFEHVLNENIKLSNFSKLLSSSFYVMMFYFALNP